MLFEHIITEMFLLCIACRCKSPIFFIPGFVGNKMNVTYDYDAPWYCPSKGTNENWVIHIPRFLPPWFFCFTNMATMKFDEKAGKARSKEGIEWDGIDFGGLSGVRSLVTLPFGVSIKAVFGDLIRQFEERGYVERENIFGIPYDWRFGTYIDESFWERTRKLIEDGVVKNNGEKAILLAHSLGAQMVLHFLTLTKSSKTYEQCLYIGLSLSFSSILFN